MKDYGHALVLFIREYTFHVLAYNIHESAMLSRYQAWGLPILEISTQWLIKAIPTIEPCYISQRTCLMLIHRANIISWEIILLHPFVL